MKYEETKTYQEEDSKQIEPSPNYRKKKKKELKISWKMKKWSKLTNKSNKMIKKIRNTKR